MKKKHLKTFLFFEGNQVAEKNTIMKQAILEAIKIKIHADNDATAEDDNGNEIYYPAIGLSVEATVLIPEQSTGLNGLPNSYKIQTIGSAGLWGISDSSNESELMEIVEEQMEDLGYYLTVLNVDTEGNKPLFKNKPTSQSFDSLKNAAIEAQKKKGFFINA